MAGALAVLAVLLMAASAACVPFSTGCDTNVNVSNETIVLGTENITEDAFKEYSSIGKASYVYDVGSKKGTLKLDGFEFVTSAPKAIKTNGTLAKGTEIAIIVNGANMISCGYGVTSSELTYGISSSTQNESLKLSIIGIGIDPTLTITTGVSSANSRGILFYPTVDIENVTVNITTGGATGDGKIVAGIDCNDLTVSHSKIEIHNDKGKGDKYGFLSSTVKVTSSEITLYCGEAADTSDGIYAFTGGTLEKSIVTAKSGNAQISYGLYNCTLKECILKDVSGFTSALDTKTSIDNIDDMLGSDSIDDPSFVQATAEKLHSYKMLRSNTVHTLTYDRNGGSGDINPSEPHYKGESFALPECTAAAPALRVFKCWSDGVNEYEAGSKYTMGDSDVTLKAVWSTTHDVIFTVDGKVVGQQTVFVGEDATRPADPSKPGYGFNGWFTDRGELWDFGNMVTKDTILIAKFSEIRDGIEVIDAEDVRSVEVGYDPNVDTVILKSADGMMRIDSAKLEGTDDRINVTMNRIAADRWNCEAVWEISKKAYEGDIDVTLPYDGSRGVPKVYCYPTGGEPERIDASVDRTSHTITFAIGHGSVYGLEYQSASNGPAWWILLVFLIAIASTLYIGTKRSRT